MKIPLHARVVARLQSRSTQSSIIGKTAEQIPELRERTTTSNSGITGFITGKVSELVVIENKHIALPGRTLRLRTYVPNTLQTAPRPVIVDYHGGGFVIGRPELKEWYNSELSWRLNALVISVDYRLAPEHQFPAAYNDAVESYSWLTENVGAWNGDPCRMVVTGDSAGANLAAGVAIAAAHIDAATAPRAQVLLYPPTDLVTDYPSATENATAPFLSVQESDAYLRHYCTIDELADARISPLASDDLHGVAPAVIITAEHDPLRDQGAAYGDALRAVGVYARVTNYPGTAHGFISTPGLYPGSSLAALGEIVTEIRQLLACEGHAGRVVS
ncbi:alpha/beta hydrolase [Rhodococcus sp. IEGM 1366]|uniref:alpha/beta hydrolase n=1 Tax=Rhodococcus sp. IEGM 1366 TaxID=3082223 RepID=UPI002953D215|nr:alpha/beta hydrolase [Rhodococcus sp. IEGM 1366]MDV8071391.1 alpha/beta hydrolase [Rhodococcus sp. IEGM 1366]